MKLIIRDSGRLFYSVLWSDGSWESEDKASLGFQTDASGWFFCVKLLRDSNMMFLRSSRGILLRSCWLMLLRFQDKAFWGGSSMTFLGVS